MTDDIDDGGPAFPLYTLKWHEEVSDKGFGGTTDFTMGISIRDYFAAKALQGFIANKANPMRFSPSEDAEWCYKIADAMLEAREK